MLKSNKVNMIISVLVAIFLWMYVVGQINPTVEENIANVPVKFVGEETLDSKGFAPVIPDEMTVTVTLRGNRTSLKTLKPEDIKAVVDVSGYTKGENKAQIVVAPPEGTKLEKVFPATVKVSVEKRIVETRKTKAYIKGELKKGSETGNVSVFPEQVEVSGARGALARVGYVMAPVSVSKITKEDSKIKTKGIPVDANGERVEHVNVHGGPIMVTASLLSVKTVALQVPTQGKINDAYDVESINLPKQVSIKGPENVLGKVERISTETLVLSDITKSGLFPLVPILPKGVELAAESRQLAAKVIIKAQSSTVFEYDAAAVSVRNLLAKFKAKVKTSNFSVTVKGKPTLIKTVKSDDIAVYIDSSTITGAGTYKLKLNGEYTKAFTDVIFNPVDVEVTVSEE